MHAIPEQKSPMAPVKFSVEAGLVHRLGEESVSDPVLAVVELVKNSYDDDAKKVTIELKNLRTGKSEIIITDDGNGMTHQKLQNSWMRIATSGKVREPLSPILKRHRLGQKGVGRFAVENLSRKTIITTCPKDSEEGYQVIFDWDSYNSENNVTDVQNVCYCFKKRKEDQGVKIELINLRQPWPENSVKKLMLFLKALTPPVVITSDFEIEVKSDEFKQLTGIVNSDFLKKAVFVFEANLTKTGEKNYSFSVPSKGTTITKIDKQENFCCGPVNFKLYFFYKQQAQLKTFGIKIDNVEDFKLMLTDYGGIKIYRDGIRISGFGNPEDDWVGLDALSLKDPTIIPSRNQVIAMVNITSADNPYIIETTTRENLIRNNSFNDMLSFIKESISVFSQMRAEAEQKRQPAPKESKAFIKESVEKTKQIKERSELLDFTDQYPLIFYRNLEQEINQCHSASLPNATLILSRKMVENLLYHILEDKFPKEVVLRYMVAQGRAQDFSVLLFNLESRIGDFEREQQDLIQKLLCFIKPFKRDANSSAHKVMEYLDTVDELARLKIPEIIQIELQLIKKIRATKS
jgi:hypothetical protein